MDYRFNNITLTKKANSTWIASFHLTKTHLSLHSSVVRCLESSFIMSLAATTNAKIINHHYTILHFVCVSKVCRLFLHFQATSKACAASGHLLLLKVVSLKRSKQEVTKYLSEQCEYTRVKRAQWNYKRKWETIKCVSYFILIRNYLPPLK